ncbi:hypothetical protein MA16_Dca028038 [Dendrobium catenatum]|uniref:Retrotransposon gag domain-containing protein n=1 Tax=Dendrobium catenatum TaxID=906689 RepID=A0A2I0V796_9ASPA|nr:hypothetical protein MA16_Dca028038 [Dendrobium catenatum]
MSWDETKAAFLRAFRPPEYADRARTELVSLRQRDGESVTSYHLRMQWILKRWPDHGLPESLVRGLFVDGLREEFHDWVMPRKPETLQEAVRLAMDWEGARTVRKGGEVRCGFCEGMHGEKDCEVRRTMREEWMRRRGRGEERKITVERKEEEEVLGEEERLGRVVSIGSIGRRSQCQCSKHQCWKKYERSGSAVTTTTVNADTTAAASAAAPVGAVSVAE